MQFPVFVELHRSRWLPLLVFLAHAVAGWGLMLPAWAAWLRISLFLGLLLSGGLAWRHLRRVPSIVVLHQDGRLEVGIGELRRGARKLDGGVILPWLCVWSYRDEKSGRRSFLCLLPDMASRDHFRRLRIWLRWCAPSNTHNSTNSGAVDVLSP